VAAPRCERFLNGWAIRIRAGRPRGKPLPNDVRTSPRKDCYKVGLLMFDEASHGLECVVWNVSAAGAMIEFSPEIVPPETFRLVARALSVDRTCRILWRKGWKVGVVFTA
jgi:hypothetical protein